MNTAGYCGSEPPCLPRGHTRARPEKRLFLQLPRSPFGSRGRLPHGAFKVIANVSSAAPPCFNIPAPALGRRTAGNLPGRWTLSPGRGSGRPACRSTPLVERGLRKMVCVNGLWLAGGAHGKQVVPLSFGAVRPLCSPRLIWWKNDGPVLHLLYAARSPFTLFNPTPS